MSESLQKRSRQETLDPQNELQLHHDTTKRQKPFNQILSILEEKQEAESDQEFSDIFQSLQQELSFDSTAVSLFSDHQNGGSTVSETDEEVEKDDGVIIMRRLLEVSDDELGIPNRVMSADDENINSREEDFSVGDGFWEFEDYDANYYDLLQTKVFM